MDPDSKPDYGPDEDECRDPSGQVWFDHDYETTYDDDETYQVVCSRCGDEVEGIHDEDD
jgi:hypothetical protein